MKKEVQIGNFCFSDPQESNAYSSVYITKPTEKFLQKFGKLAILSNINFKDSVDSKTKNWAEEWIEKMANLAKGNFYQNRSNSIRLEENLENLLQQLNVWLSQEKVSQPKIFEEKIESYDFTVLALKDKEIQFSQIGTIKAILIENQSSENLGEEKKPNKTEKFTNIISGNLQKNNILFFANEEVLDYFSVEKIIQILKNTPLDQIQKEFKNLIKEESPSLNMIGLALSSRSKIQKEEREKEVKEKTTKVKEVKKREKKEKANKPTTPSSTSAPLPRKKMTFSRPQNKQKKWLNKLLLGGILICIVLFGGSLVFLKRQQKIAMEREQYAQTLNNIEKKQEQLESALLSSLEEAPTQVGEIFQEIKTMIQELPRRTEEEEQIFQNFTTEYKEKFNNYYQIKEISNPLQITDLKLIDPEVKTQGLALVKENLYIFNPENNYIYRLDLSDNQTEIINKISANVGYLQKLYPKDEDSLIGYDQNQNLNEFNIIDNQLSELNLSTDHPKTEIADLKIYNRRLYLLQPSLNQIYKYQKTIDGFGQEEAWLKDENIDISQGVSLAIDSSIYVLQGNGSIEKLYQGGKENFRLDHFQPQLSPGSTGKILTNDELSKIYILDPSTKRIIILDKQGQLKQQLIFNSLENNEIKDFAVNPQEDKIWILSGSQVLEIEIDF
ncbi:hypothetical protein K9K85_03015 [Patescibacteria group bacterium]|nr:hypothetical protein [Patescibacteria group bacterium]